MTENNIDLRARTYLYNIRDVFTGTKNWYQVPNYDTLKGRVCYVCVVCWAFDPAGTVGRTTTNGTYSDTTIAINILSTTLFGTNGSNTWQLD